MPQYESAFANYKPFREVELADWRAASPRDASATGKSGRAAAGTPPATGTTNGIITAPMTDHGKMNHKE